MLCPNCHSYISGDHCRLCNKNPIKGIKKTNSIKKISEKKKKQDKLYKELRKQFLKDHPICAVYPPKKATQIHHKKGRGKYYLDVSTWLAVSMEGHRQIEDNPQWAKMLGFSESRLT